MNDYIDVIKDEDIISLCLSVCHSKILAISKNINKINKGAYMNGYNWEVFFDYYLSLHNPKVMDNMDADPEAAIYIVYYAATPSNQIKLDKFVEIIRSLIENEEDLYQIIREKGSEIEWN